MPETKLELSRRYRKKMECTKTMLSAARSLFEVKGYEATSIDEIAELANVSRGTFFNYFPTKDSLLVKMLEEEAEDILFYLENDLAGYTSPIEKIYRLMLFLIEDTINFRATCRILGDKIGIITTANDLFHALVSLVEEARKKGEISNDKNPNHIAVMLMGLHLTIVSYNSIIPSTKKNYCKMLDILFCGFAGQHFNSAFLQNPARKAKAKPV
jgi:AcrR family transcriptional regulator